MARVQSPAEFQAFLGLGVGAAAIAVAILMHQTTGAGFGATCSSAADCRGSGSTCLFDQSRSLGKAFRYDDCPTGTTCEAIGAPTGPGGVIDEDEAKVEHICH